MAHTLLSIRISKVNAGGRQLEQQIAMQFQKRLKFVVGPAGSRLAMEAPSIWRSELGDPLTLEFNDDFTAVGVQHEVWLAVNNSLEESAGHRILANTLAFTGDDLTDILHHLRSASDCQVRRDSEEKIDVDEYFDSMSEPFEKCSDDNYCPIIWLRDDIHSPDIDDLVIQIPTDPSSKYGHTESWQIAAYILVFEEILSDFLRLAQETLGRRLERLKDTAAFNRSSVERKAQADDGWSDLIRAGQLRHAWALLITQSQELMDVAQGGSKPYRFAKWLMQELGIGSKLEAIASVLGATEQLIASTSASRQTVRESHESDPHDSLMQVVKTVFTDNININEVVERLKDISDKTAEQATLNKLMLVALIIVGMVVIGQVMLKLFF